MKQIKLFVSVIFLSSFLCSMNAMENEGILEQVQKNIFEMQQRILVLEQFKDSTLLSKEERKKNRLLRASLRRDVLKGNAEIIEEGIGAQDDEATGSYENWPNEENWPISAVHENESGTDDYSPYSSTEIDLEKSEPFRASLKLDSLEKLGLNFQDMLKMDQYATLVKGNVFFNIYYSKKIKNESAVDLNPLIYLLINSRNYNVNKTDIEENEGGC